MAIGTPVAIGTAQNKTSETSTVLTTTAAVPAGAAIFVACAADGIFSPNFSVSDGSNTYDVSIMMLDAADIDICLAFALNVSALSSGSNITVNWGQSNTSKAISAFYVEGLATSSALDQIGSATGSSGTPSVTTAGSTENVAQIVIGVLGTEGSSGDSFTQDAVPAYSTPPTRVGTSGGGAASNITVAGGHIIKTPSVTTVTYNPTCTSRDWAALIATFKEGSSNATGTVAQTLPNLEQSASGTSILDVTGTSAQTLPKLAQSAAGTSIENLTGTVAQTLPSLAQSESAKEVFSGSAAQALPALTQSASAKEVFSGAAVQTLPRLAQSASAEETIIGSAAQTLPKLAQAADGTVTSTAVSGATAQTLPALAQAIATSEIVVGNAAQTLPKLMQATSGTSTAPNATGTIAQLLPALMQGIVGQFLGLVASGDLILHFRRRRR